MNCRDCRDQLLNVLDPSAVPPEVAAHLEECTACAQLRRRLVQIEDNATRIPAPPSQGPAALKRKLLEPASPPVRLPGLSRQMVLAWAAAGVAVCLVLGVFIVAWSRRGARDEPPIADRAPSLPPPAPSSKPPAEPPAFLARVLDCDVKLANAESPEQRLAGLSDLTGFLQEEGRSAPSPKVTRAVAAMYRETLRDTLLPLAAQLPVEQREKTLVPLVQGLARFHEHAVQLAPTDPSLAEMAQLAKESRGELLALLPGAILAPPPENREPHKSRDWSADAPLVHTMVATARKLALEKEPLQRAQLAQDLAEQMGREIQSAAKSNQGHRAAELSAYFNTLLTEAVARNLSLVHHRAPADTPPPDDLNRFVAAVARSTQSVEAHLKDAAGNSVEGANMEAAFQAVVQGRQEVENTAKGKGKNARPPNKGKGKGPPGSR